MKHNQEFIDYRATLPKGRGGIDWTIESFSIAVELLAPGFVVEDGQEWKGSHQPVWVVCPVHGRYQVYPNNFLAQCKGSGCAKCRTQKLSDSAGKRRSARATESEKNEARKLYLELGSYREVARITRRSATTIQLWCDPDFAEKNKLNGAKWKKENRGRDRANSKRYNTEFLHGRVNRAQARAMRRGIYRDYDDDGNIIYQELETYSAEDEIAMRKHQARLKELNDTNYMGIKWSEEHLLPLSQGGEHNWWNLSITPLKDNISKNNKIVPSHMALRVHKIARMFQNVA